MSTDNKRLRELRDAVLRYIYKNGATNPYFSVDEDDLQRDLNITRPELSAVWMVLHNQDLLPGRGEGIGGMIGLSERGQAEAERLGPEVLMREQPSDKQTIHINAAYSVVQIAGHGSTQTANLQVEKPAIEDLLTRIEAELEVLKIDTPTKDQAAGLVASLRQGVAAKLGDAGLRAMGAALSGILNGAGSSLGKSLAKLLGITSG